MTTDAPPAALGYRWPAEWEPHAATWLAWPRNPETWPGRLDRALDEFAGIVDALHTRERVEVAVDGARAEAAARARLTARGVDVGRLSFRAIATDDAWMRDSGPIFVRRDAEPRTAALDFAFDSWGGKYPPWDRDAAVAERVAHESGVVRYATDFVLEGGSIDGDGRGTVLTTESCLLNPNRGARGRGAVERVLADWLGARHVIWLPGGIEGDDTDGHVDDVARFVAPGTVVAAVEPDAADPNHEPLRRNLERLRAARDADGRALTVAELPMPPRIAVAGQRLPASYANFYLANGVALVPVFGCPTDDGALAVLRELLPDRRVVPVPCRELVAGLGAVHCLTQQQPV